MTNKSINVLAFSGTDLFAGTNGGGVYLSANNGKSWTAVNANINCLNVHAFTVSGTNFFAGSCGYAYLYDKEDTIWTNLSKGLSNFTILALTSSGTNLFAGTYGGGVYLSTNNGTSWTPVNAGLTNTNVNNIVVSGTNLIIGTKDGGVWRRQLSEMITSLKMISPDLPDHFSLSQNYPNPFNPVTTIKYQAPKPCMVTIKVYDILGREVATLVSENKIGGSYDITFNASGVASGVYYYSMAAGNFTETKKLVLLK